MDLFQTSMLFLENPELRLLPLIPHSQLDLLQIQEIDIGQNHRKYNLQREMVEIIKTIRQKSDLQRWGVCRSIHAQTCRKKANSTTVTGALPKFTF